MAHGDHVRIGGARLRDDRLPERQQARHARVLEAELSGAREPCRQQALRVGARRRKDVRAPVDVGEQRETLPVRVQHLEQRIVELDDVHVLEESARVHPQVGRHEAIAEVDPQRLQAACHDARTGAVHARDHEDAARCVPRGADLSAVHRRHLR